jgi:hypothetical protein
MRRAFERNNSDESAQGKRQLETPERQDSATVMKAWSAAPETGSLFNWVTEYMALPAGLRREEDQ